MDAVFLKLLNMSLTAIPLIIAVLLLRLALQKAPRRILCVLWALVALRLLCPVTIESPWSLLPGKEVISFQQAGDTAFTVHTGIGDIDGSVNRYLTEQSAGGAVIPAEPAGEERPFGKPDIHWLAITGAVWLLGAAAIGIYGLASYLRLRKGVRGAVRLEENVYLCGRIPAAFILGVFRPRIYLPSDLERNRIPLVLAHERMHLKRLDPYWKLLGFAALALHWFNPLVWLGYHLFCRDLELACDEAVIRRMDGAGRRAYSEALLACSFPRRHLAAYPLAFGEVGVKTRIRAVLNYKKPGFWVVALALMACITAGACFLTSPMEQTAEASGIPAGTEQGEPGETRETLPKQPEDLRLQEEREARQSMHEEVARLEEELEELQRKYSEAMANGVKFVPEMPDDFFVDLCSAASLEGAAASEKRFLDQMEYQDAHGQRYLVAFVEIPQDCPLLDVSVTVDGVPAYFPSFLSVTGEGGEAIVQYTNGVWKEEDSLADFGSEALSDTEKLRIIAGYVFQLPGGNRSPEVSVMADGRVLSGPAGER